MKYILLILLLLLACDSTEVERLLKEQKQLRERYTKDSLEYEIGIVNQYHNRYNGVAIRYVKDRRTDLCFAFMRFDYDESGLACVPCSSISEELLVNKKPQKPKIITIIKQDSMVIIDSTPQDGTSRIPEITSE